jgi:hypothetical protein
VFPIPGLTTVASLVLFLIFKDRSNGAVVTVRSGCAPRGAWRLPRNGEVAAVAVAAVQVVNLVVTPIGLLMMPMFMKIGLIAVGAAEMVSVDTITTVSWRLRVRPRRVAVCCAVTSTTLPPPLIVLQAFKTGMLSAMAAFAWPLFYGVVAWLVLCPLLVFVVFRCSFPIAAFLIRQMS